MTRVFYPDCAVEVSAWGETSAFACDDAEVWIDGDSILVSYFDEDGIVVLEGQPDGAGGWALVARSRPRRANLSPIGDDSRRFEGTIEEQGEGGHWELCLGEPAEG